jgi:hypothetical protein
MAHAYGSNKRPINICLEYIHNMTEGGKRRANKSLKQWVAFVKKVAKEEGLEYKDAMKRAKARSDKGEKWQKGGAEDDAKPTDQTTAVKPTEQTPSQPTKQTTPAQTPGGGEGEQMEKPESTGGQRQRQQRSAKQRRSARQQRKGGQRQRQQSRRNRRQSRRERR